VRRMRLKEPRVAPLPEAEWSEEARELLSMTGGVQGGRALNIFTTFARHPALMKRWLVFGTHVLFQSTFPFRERELAILRVGWLCQAEYEWGQHVLIGEQCGLTPEEIARIQRGPAAPGWSASDRALLQAVDELHADRMITDDTYRLLAEKWSTEQLMDFVFAVGQYELVSMALNTFGVQLDAGIPGFDGKVR
jgi:4-carboxymuconolactone decarboxylase